jgi:hypothetical protein
MEGNINLNLNLERSKFHLKTNQKQVKFSNNNLKFISLINSLNDVNERNNNLLNINTITNINMNSNNSIIKNINVNTNKNKKLSPRKSKSIIPDRKQSFQTPITFRTSFRKKGFETPIKIENNEKNFISPNLNTNNINNLTNNSENKNDMSFKRTNTNSSLKPRLSMFSLKNKRMSNNKVFYNIKFRNSDLDNNKFKYLFKSEGDEKTGVSSLLSDRKKIELTTNDENNYNKNDISRRSSICSNKIKSHIIKKKFIYRRTNTISNSKLTGKVKVNFFQKKNKYNANKNSIPIIVNPLLISEEDKIFDEMKKYLCFKYEKRRAKTKSKEQKRHEKPKNSSSNTKKIKNKIQTTDKIKLDYLYINTIRINKKIRHIKKKKDKQDLAEYQNKLLDIIKPSVSDYTYTHLKDRLIEIRMKNNKKYQYNLRNIKEIENKEEKIIQDFNKTCVKCLRTFRRVRAQKEVLHSTNLKIKLPLLNFISCLKKKKNHNAKRK